MLDLRIVTKAFGEGVRSLNVLLVKKKNSHEDFVLKVMICAPSAFPLSRSFLPFTSFSSVSLFHVTCKPLSIFPSSRFITLLHQLILLSLLSFPHARFPHPTLSSLPSLPSLPRRQVNPKSTQPSSGRLLFTAR